MANQDDYIKTALRLPRALHARLLKASRDSSKSLNAEIVARLDDSFNQAATEDAMRDLAASVEELQDDVKAIRQAVVASDGRRRK